MHVIRHLTQSARESFAIDLPRAGVPPTVRMGVPPGVNEPVIQPDVFAKPAIELLDFPGCPGTQIAAAAAFGWIVFRTLPDAWGWVGMAVITACGATSAWLNVRHASLARRPASAVTADAMAE